MSYLERDEFLVMIHQTRTKNFYYSIGFMYLFVNSMTSRNNLRETPKHGVIRPWLEGYCNDTLNWSRKLLI